MKAPVGDFPYVDMAVMQQVEFLCLLAAGGIHRYGCFIRSSAAKSQRPLPEKLFEEKRGFVEQTLRT